MALDISQLIKELQQQKQKYHAKVLSESAINLNFQRILDVSDLMAYHIWLSIPPICWSAISPLPLFDLQPFEIEPLVLDFKIEIPHVEFDIPRDLLEKLVSLPPVDAVALLPPDIRSLLLSILAPGMTLEDIMLILRDIYPPTIIPFLPDIVHIDLPNFRAIWHGIYLIITKLDLSEIYDWLKDLEKFLKENLKEPYASEMLGSMRLKGVYDETPYDQSYYDPNVLRNFLRSTFTKLFLQYLMVRTQFEAISSAGEINLDILKELYNRFQMIKESFLNNFILGYNLLGYSKLSTRVEEKTGDKTRGKIMTRFIDYDGIEREVIHYSVDHLQWGFILDVSHLDVGFLMPEDTVYKLLPATIRESLAYEHKTEGAPPIAHLVYDRAKKMNYNAVWTPLTFGNYNKPEEMQSYLRSERTDQWFELQVMYTLIDNMIEPILDKYGVDGYTRRVYKNAVRQLIGLKTKRHKWGMQAWFAMDDAEFKNWWIQNWASQGLKKEILEELYMAVEPCLQRLRNLKLQLSNRVRLKRLKLAYLA